VNLESVTALSALQAGSDLLILRSPKTLEHIRKYLGSITEKTDLASMAVDMSLAAEPPKEPAKPTAAAPKPVEPPKPKVETKPALKAVEPPKPPEITAEAVAAVAKPPVPAAALTVLVSPPVAQEENAEYEVDVPGELSDEDIAALRQMVGAFRAIRAFVSDLGDRLLNR
jgi:hypothetical protein